MPQGADLELYRSRSLKMHSVRVEPDEDTWPVWREHGNPRLIGIAQLLLVELQLMGRRRLAVARPVANALDRLAETVQLIVRPLVVPGPGTAEMPLEQLTKPDEAVRAEYRNQEALDLAPTACGATVLLLVEDACHRPDHNVQPSGAVIHAIWIEEHVPPVRHGGIIVDG